MRDAGDGLAEPLEPGEALKEESPDVEDIILDRLAFSMMAAELGRADHETLSVALMVPSEVQRTYKRLLASGEAKAMLNELNRNGLRLSANGTSSKPCDAANYEPSMEHHGPTSTLGLSPSNLRHPSR
jgi:hypothetical protein